MERATSRVSTNGPKLHMRTSTVRLTQQVKAVDVPASWLSIGCWVLTSAVLWCRRRGMSRRLP